MNQKEIKELIELLVEKDITEFEIERGDVKLHIKRGGSVAGSAGGAGGGSGSSAAPVSAPPATSVATAGEREPRSGRALDRSGTTKRTCTS